MSDFFQGKKCELCGKPATCAHFGRFLCDDRKCMDSARETRECAGKTMKKPEGTVGLDELMKKRHQPPE
jgi:hypothetical protein